MTDVLIKRELLERAWRQLANYDTGKMIGAVLDAAPCDPGCAEICVRASMCATCMADMEGPRQQEGEGLDVVESLHVWRATNRFGDTCHFGDAGCARAWAGAGGKVNRIELKPVPELYDVNYAATLRQQLAERDAEIERLRVKLMTIASAEPGRHNIEWAKAMAATGNNEAYAKWREAFDQRDKLVGLLREVRVIVAREVERWARAAAILPVNAIVESGLLTRIDAALAKVDV